MEVAILEQMHELLAVMRENKPARDAEHAREWAVGITEMEKVEAWWMARMLSRNQIIEAIKAGVI
jgi:hypothetical protein